MGDGINHDVTICDVLVTSCCVSDTIDAEVDGRARLAWGAKDAAQDD